MSRYVSESCLSPFLDLDSSALKALLPKATVQSLQRFGYRLTPDATGEDGASTPIRDETLSHYGLRYLEKAELRSIENRDVIDAGSFDGSSARFFLQNHPIQRVFCFEPDPANFAHLMNDSQAELSSGRIVATQVALSNRMGLAIMSPAGMGSSRAKAELVAEPRIVVRSKTIDVFLKDFPEANIGLIKLDVEGDAVLALQGAVQTIRTHRPVLIVSFYHTPQEFAETPPYLLDTFPAPGAPQRDVCRERLGLAPETRVILLAVHKSSNKRKGFSLAAQALAKLAVADDGAHDICVAVLGSVDKDALSDLALPFKVVSLGFISEEEQKSVIYKAADVCLVPSLQESLSVVASDSIRNGTPVVCFKSSGLQSFVRHKANGYTASAFDTDDLSRGLQWALFDCDARATRSAAAETGQELFAPENNIERYEQIIDHAIRNHAAQDFDTETFEELTNLFQCVGQDSRYRHVVRRHLEKSLKKTKVG
ncbi:FkbM family methyltransferase [Marivita geojedonensis]|uniref:FkbM family methyltransferase n=1 Tax=Marivita geojedonensis TaxID=1123756 RepID=UPI00117F0705|nr:FkbM family methyltransferase [Marivita geojedonensis]